LSIADADLVEAKRVLRGQALAQRDRARVATGDHGRSAAQALSDHALAALAGELARPRRVSAYNPVGSEMDPLPLYGALLERGHVGGLPAVAGRHKPLVFRQWRPGEALVAGVLGIPIPPPEAPVIEPDLLLVPLLAFDRAGYRLGYGGGFYDRTLQALRRRGPMLAVGVAFAAQELARVPHGADDQKLDWIATERGAWAVGE
jgi:5-formyltetrahydrofolate cyclo-ligase